MNELCHHGIKGQKWGIRRYQNEDGTYTPEGAARRREELKKMDLLTSDKLYRVTYNPKTKTLSPNKKYDAERNRKAAELGLKALRIRDKEPMDYDPNDKGWQQWFLEEDQTIGLPMLADLVVSGKTKQEVNQIISDFKNTLIDDIYYEPGWFDVSEGLRSDKSTDKYIDALYEAKKSK